MAGVAPSRARFTLVLLAVAPFVASCGSSGNTSGTGSTGTLSSGVEGRVVLEPNCPVAGAPECDRHKKAVRADVVVKRAAPRFKGTPVVTTISTDSGGRFHVNLPAGRYLLEARSSRPGVSPTPINVTVRADSVSRVELPLDTGMR